MKRIVFVLAFSLIPLPARAQTPPQNNAISWEQENETVQTAMALLHYYYLDGAAQGLAYPTKSCVQAVAPVTPLPNVTCTGTLPALTAGQHTIVMTAERAGDPGSVTPKSAPLTFMVSIQPVTPKNLRLVPKATQPTSQSAKEAQEFDKRSNAAASKSEAKKPVTKKKKGDR